MIHTTNFMLFLVISVVNQVDTNDLSM